MARLIDADKIYDAIERRYQVSSGIEHRCERDFLDLICESDTVDAVEVVRCKECRWAKPYERMDGKTGYYCQFCGHSFKYGNDWERLYNPIKESDDFCSYGERKDGDGNG